MIVAIDADCLPVLATVSERSDEPDLTVYTFSLVRALQSTGSPVDRVVVVTRPENHGRFEPLRDDRTDIASVARPLFEGRPVTDWPTLLDQHPRLGADLLAAHHDAKLRLLAQLGAQVVHFPTDARELMEIDLPIVVTVAHARPSLSATLADAVIVHRPGLASHLPHAKTFLASFPSTGAGPRADDDPTRALLAALNDAYEHALASYELRKAA